WEYGTITTHSRPPRGSAALTLPGLGDARRGFTWPRADKVSLQIIFRRGRYNAALTVLVPARYHIQDFVRLARTLDSRIRADG
ncbi:MAG TPA: hypothetical protein VE219_01675, partial [Candidatus Sulfotelmatobacter sp.]|nr:hypothetical protein [Candidatus Sulfotelmatobacter sp.]